MRALMFLVMNRGRGATRVRKSGLAVMIAIAAGATTLGGTTGAGAQTPLTAPSVVWPVDAGIARRGGNGLSIDRDVASTPESLDYVLTALSVSADDIIRFSYAESAAPEAETAGSCDFTFRRVERTLTQAQANELAGRLGGMEMRTLKDGRRGLDLVGPVEVRGSPAVRHHVQAFTAGSGEDRTRGLGKTWIFVREGRAYYVHKRCETHGGQGMLAELDQRIGLDYRRDPAPGDVAEAAPMMAWAN